MVREELKYELIRQGVQERSFDLFGEGRDECYCMQESQTGWIVYYRERGLQSDEHVFESENSACKFLLKKILGDPSTRISVKEI